MEEGNRVPLARRFKDPPNEFRMMPFWFWNHECVEKEIVRQVHDHHAHGIGGEFIHPRHGRLTPYMGRRWLEAVEAAADACKALDMPCFLYDEDNWPSGPAGGYITGPYRPENRAKFLVLFDEDVFEGHVEYELDHAKIPEAVFFAAIAVPDPPSYPSFAEVAARWVDVSAFVTGTTFRWDAPPGEWHVMFFCVVTNPPDGNLNGYIDILRPETVREFIDFTHKKYADWFVQRGKADYLGTVVPGIFTDEPSLAHMNVSEARMLPWVTFTAAMPARFKAMFGYDFNEILVSLVHDTGDIAAKHRCDFWACTVDMYVNAFYKPIYDFCDSVHWRATGHVNSEGSFPSHVKNHGDFFKVFEYMHYGGVDQLTEDVRPDGIEHFWNVDRNPYTGMAHDMVLASKLASSAAHLLGKPRVLVEAWGTSSWDITMASAKRVNDYLVATGCDLFVPHSFNISEDGYRKGDHPAAFNYQPYYTHWKRLADHNARLCAVLNAASGVLVPEVLFLYPAKSFHAELAPSETPMATHLANYLTHNADCLFRQQVDFELASEEIILKGTVEGDRIRIGNQTFKVLLLGAATCVTVELARFARQFYEAGGKVLATFALPWKDARAGASDEIESIFAGMFGTSPRALKATIQAARKAPFTVLDNQNPAGGRAVLVTGYDQAPWQGAYYPAFEDACRRVLPLEARDTLLVKEGTTGEHPAYVMVAHKTIDGREVYFLANTSRDASYVNVDVSLDVRARGIEAWDTLDGSITPFTAFSVDGPTTRLRLAFPPHASHLLVVDPAPGGAPAGGAGVATPVHDPTGEVMLLDGPWRCGLQDPNGAMLYKDWHSSYRVEAGRAWGYHSTRAFSHAFIVQDVERVKPVQLVIEGLVGSYAWAKDTIDMPRGGDRATFTFPPSVQIVVNGARVPVSFTFELKYLDAYWIVEDISRFLVEGRNEVGMTCTTRNHATFHVVTDPWRLIGSFEVDEHGDCPVLKPARTAVELGDLRTQGFPRYHGGFSYARTVPVPAAMAGKRVMLELAGTTDSVEVHVNGVLVDVLWHRWAVDITPHVTFGAGNEIVLVHYGIAQNMLQTDLKGNGLQATVSLRYVD